MINIDMVKARDIWREKIRQSRSEQFAELDIAFMRAVEQGNTEEQKRIANEKQFLRDLTKDPDIDAANTIDDLKAIWKL